MKHPVSDEAVSQWVERMRVGGPTNDLFPARMSDCEFTDAQKEQIRKARADRKARTKKSKSTLPSPIEAPVVLAPSDEPKARPLTKLRKMLYLQSGRCFFCGELLDESEASIEHLHPISKGGVRTEDNEVVCHKSLNETFGHMDLKRKVEFILKASGNFRCPNNEK